jgi:hypothetical protein
MEGYVSGRGRVPFRGQAPEVEEFTLWLRAGEVDPLLFVYVPRFRVDLDPALEWVRFEGAPTDSGHMVPLPLWNVRVDPSGRMRLE